MDHVKCANIVVLMTWRFQLLISEHYTTLCTLHCFWAVVVGAAELGKSKRFITNSHQS